MKRAKQLTFNEFETNSDESGAIGSMRGESKRNKRTFREVKGYYDLPEGWRWIKLADISIVNPSKREVSNLPDETNVSFIPMAYVDENSGIIINQDIKKLGEVRQGYTYFKEGDILFAKITPCMENGKCAVAKGLINGIGFGSTEFHVIRPKDEYVLSEYIHLYLRQEWVRVEATRHFTGAVGQQRVPDSFLKRLPIPLPFKNNKPDLEEQKRIIAKIEELFSKIDRIKELRRQAKEEAETLLKVALHHVFSRADEKGWRWVKLGDICEIRRGGSPRPKGDPRYFSKENTGIHWIKISDISKYANGFYLMNTDEFLTKEGVKRSLFVRKGTLILTNSGTVGIPIILMIDGCIHDGFLALLDLDANIDQEYLAYWFIYYRKNIQKLAPSGTQANLNTTIAKKIKVPFPFKNNKPDLEEQKHIAAYLDKIAEKQRKLLELYEQTERELEIMKQAILSKAFRGEL